MLMANTARGGCRRFPGVLASFDRGAQRIAVDAVGPLQLGVGVLVVGRADDEALAHALDKGP